MMTVGMRLEDGVREGRLVRECNPTDSSEEKDQEMSMVNGGPQQHIRFITLLSLLRPTPMMFKIWVISPNFHSINNSLDNRLQEHRLI